MAPRTRGQSSKRSSKSASTSTTTSTTTSKTRATKATASPEETAFLEQCIAKIKTTPLPVLAELHQGFAPVQPGETPPRPMNCFILFKAWASQVLGSKGAYISGGIWGHLKTLTPKSQILVCMERLAEQLEDEHRAAYPGYVFRPKTKEERKLEKVDKPYTRKRSRRGKASKAGSVEIAEPAVASTSVLTIPEEAAPESGAEIFTEQDARWDLHNISDVGGQAHQPRLFLPHGVAENGQINQRDTAFDPYVIRVPDVGYASQGGEVKHYGLPEVLPQIPSSTPSLGMTETPPDKFESFVDLLFAPLNPASGAEPIVTAQEDWFALYCSTPPNGDQTHEQNPFGPYSAQEDGHFNQANTASDAYFFPDAGYPSKDDQFDPFNIPDTVPQLPFPFTTTRPSPTPSLTRTATPPEEDQPFPNLFATAPDAWDISMGAQAQEPEMGDGIEADGRFYTWAEFHEWTEQQLEAEGLRTDATKLSRLSNIQRGVDH